MHMSKREMWNMHKPLPTEKHSQIRQITEYDPHNDLVASSAPTRLLRAAHEVVYLPTALYVYLHSFCLGRDERFKAT